MGPHRLAAAAVLAAAALASAAASAQERNLGRNLAANCANCHGTNGRSQGGMPALAGRNKDELARNMNEFKSGARSGPQSTIMHQLAKGYSDEQIALIADYLSRQKPAQ
jgi:cytochrome c553